MKKSRSAAKKPRGPSPSPSERSKAPKKTQPTSTERIHWWSEVWRTVRSFGKYGVIIACAWCTYKSIDSLSGKTTVFQGLLSALADIKLNEGAAWVLASLCGGGYVYERRLRQRTVKSLNEYIRQLERQIDPGRSSSGLTVRGTPRKEDVDD